MRRGAPSRSRVLKETTLDIEKDSKRRKMTLKDRDVLSREEKAQTRRAIDAMRPRVASRCGTS